MNIVQLTPSAVPRTGGLENHVARLTAELVASGHAVRTITLSGSGQRGVAAEGNGRWVTASRRDLAWADVVHAHASRSLFTAAGIMASRSPVIFTPHCFYPPRSAVNRLEKAVFDATVGRAAVQRASRVIALSEADRDDACKLYKLKPDKIALIPNAVDFAALDECLASPTGERQDFAEYFVFTGRLDANKNAIQLVRVAEELLRGGRHLVLVGPDGGQLTRLEAMKSSLPGKVRSRVHVLGRVPFVDLVHLVAGARMLILPSGYEGLPTSVLEAVGLGVPCAVSDRGGNAALAARLATVHAFRFDDDAELVRTVTRALQADDPDTKAQVAEQVRHEYSWTTVSARIADLYRQVSHA